MNIVMGKGRPYTFCTLNIPLVILYKLDVLNNIFQKAKKEKLSLCPFIHVLVEAILMKEFLALEVHFSYTMGKNVIIYIQQSQT